MTLQTMMVFTFGLAPLLLVRAGFFGIYHIAYFLNFMHDNFTALHLVFTLITPTINLLIIGGVLLCIPFESVTAEDSSSVEDELRPDKPRFNES